MITVHPNDCGHKPHQYYGAVRVDGYGLCDLYFFEGLLSGWKYCLRYGDAGDYCSFPIESLSRLCERKGYEHKDHVVLSSFSHYMRGEV